MSKKFLHNTILALLFLILAYIGLIYFRWVIWFAFVPVILLLIYTNNLKDIIFQLLLISIITPVATAYYIVAFDKVYFFYAILYSGSYSWFLCLITYIGIKRIKYPLHILVPPFVILFLIFLYSMTPWGVFWFNLGSYQPMLFPFNYIIGGYGITFIVFLFNSLIAFYLASKKKSLFYSVILLSIILIICFLFSFFSAPAGRKIKIAIIQGNFPQDWAWRTSHANSEVFDTYRNLSLEAAKQSPDIIIWPEYAIPADILIDKELYEKISSLAKETKSNLIFGSLVNAPKTDPNKNLEWDTAFVFSRQGKLIGRYDSILPFPYKNWVITGKKLQIIDTDIGKFGVSMCYEENYPSIFSDYKKLGAKFYISLVNDSPINDMRQIRLKSIAARARASENNLYLLRAANTGITEVINPYGKVISKLEPNKQGILYSEIFIK